MNIPCICPPKGDAPRHPDGDEITFREKLDFRGVTTIRWAVAIERERDPGADLADSFAVVTEHYILQGIESWSLVDEKGKPIPVSKDAIRSRLLTHPTEAQAVGDHAESLYQAVMLPLLREASTSSPPSPTDASTSPRNGSEAKPQKRSKPSSISTIPTAATATTTSSLDGDSSSSQSSTSAA